MTHRNLLGTLLVVVGVLFGTLALNVAVGFDKHPPVVLGALSGVVALVALGGAWKLLLEPGTPHERIAPHALAAKKKPADGPSVHAEAATAE